MWGCYGAGLRVASEPAAVCSGCSGNLLHTHTVQGLCIAATKALRMRVAKGKCPLVPELRNSCNSACRFRPFD